MKTQVCKCAQCKHGRRHLHDTAVRHKVKMGRKRVKQEVNGGNYEVLPQVVLTGYTD